MILYIVRHAEPDYEKDCLTELGWRQAEAVGERLAAAGVNKVFASSMGRAQETATPLCRRMGIDFTVEPWAREISGKMLFTTYPDGIPKSLSRVQNTHFLENGNRDLGYEHMFDCPGIRESGMKEALGYLRKNGDEFLERLGYRYENGVYRIVNGNDDRVALFCHAAMSRAWISELLHIPLNVMWASFGYEFTGVTALEFRNNYDGVTAPHCLCYSDYGHLTKDMLPEN